MRGGLIVCSVLFRFRFVPSRPFFSICSLFFSFSLSLPLTLSLPSVPLTPSHSPSIPILPFPFHLRLICSPSFFLSLSLFLSLGSRLLVRLLPSHTYSFLSVVMVCLGILIYTLLGNARARLKGKHEGKDASLVSFLRTKEEKNGEECAEWY